MGKQWKRLLVSFMLLGKIKFKINQLKEGEIYYDFKYFCLWLWASIMLGPVSVYYIMAEALSKVNAHVTMAEKQLERKKG